MQHPIPYLPAMTMIGTSHRDAPSVLATEAHNHSVLLNDIAAHKFFGRTTAHGVALDFEFAGFKK